MFFSRDTSPQGHTYVRPTVYNVLNVAGNSLYKHVQNIDRHYCTITVPA